MVVFLFFVIVTGGCSIIQGFLNQPEGAKLPSIRPAHTEMADADKRWHNYRAESLRLKLAGKRDESEYYDRLADAAYNKSNMYYHRIQSGNFSSVEEENKHDAMAAAEEQAARVAEARRQTSLGADVYATWVAKGVARPRPTK